MTLDQFCLSTRANQLLRWQQAFPEGRIDTSLVRLERSLRNDTLVWVHGDDLAPELLQDAVVRLCRLPRVHRVVVMSSNPNPQQTVAMLGAGATGYCHALAAPELFRRIAVVVSNGGFWIGSEFLQLLTGSVSRSLHPAATTAAAAILEQLSNREREVAIQVQNGASNKEIAAALDITERTVKAHLGSIFGKLGIRDRLQLMLLLTGH